MKSPERPKPTEAEFLEQEAERARMGIAQALAGITRSAKDAANPVAWARERPFESVTAALALGLVSGFVTGRGSKKSAPRPKEPLVVEGRFRGVGRPAGRRHRTMRSAASVGVRWATRAFFRSLMPV